MKSRQNKENRTEVNSQEKRKKKKLGNISKKLMLQHIAASFVNVKT
jgi:hypothetical protein